MYKIVWIILNIFLIINTSHANDEYFLTLRNDTVNLRLGPSFQHPVKILYKKKFLPVIVLDHFENFRKIKDHENNTGWIHISQLSKKKAAIITEDNQLIFYKPSIYSKPTAILKKGRLCKIKKCIKHWCKINVETYKGWVKKESLWGLL